MQSRRSLARGWMLASTGLVAIAATPLGAQDGPSLNMYGATGLIDMPSAESQPDGILNTSTAHFGPISRTTLSFQLTPRISGSFRFLGIRDFDKAVPSIWGTYYDRSFDLRYQIFDEGQYTPALAIGLQDLVGTGILSGEYIVATKSIGQQVKVTAGLGWGRLGSYQDIGSPFGDRTPINTEDSAEVEFGNWFKGPMAPFAGIEYSPTDRWTLKAEYSSDIYDLEAGTRKTFDRKSPFNFGAEYKVMSGLRVGGYYMYGSEFGLAAHITMNPKQRPMGGITDGAPDPVKPRPSRAADPDAWSSEWVTQPDAAPLLIANLNKRLEGDGIRVEALGYDGTTAQVRIRNDRYDAEAQAIGRTARAMANAMPASIEVFEIVPVENGIRASKVTIRRSDVERLEHAPDGEAQMRARTAISPAGAAMPGSVMNPDLYPRLSWSVSPYTRIRLFDQLDPFKVDLGLRAAGTYELAPGLSLRGSVTKKLVGNLDDRPPMPERALQPVRSGNYYYDADGDPAIEQLAFHWNTNLAPEVYGRVSLGYLERMFGGISTEVLYKPVNRRWAVGAELNYVAQRSPEQDLGFDLPQRLYQTDGAGTETGPDSYKVLTGHVSGYYAFENGLHVQVDVGKYLAGDVGATLSLNREFANGWRVGAFATKTDVSADDFGAGSFDKGIRLEIPFAWATGAPSRKSAVATIRPFGRDGGQRLEVDGRLYETLRDYDENGIDSQWGRFWK